MENPKVLVTELIPGSKRVQKHLCGTIDSTGTRSQPCFYAESCAVMWVYHLQI